MHFLPATFADRGPKPLKQRPYFGDYGRHFNRKTQGFAPESVFKPEYTRSHDDHDDDDGDDDDDVVDMMVRMLPMTIVRNSEVF